MGEGLPRRALGERRVVDDVRAEVADRGGADEREREQRPGDVTGRSQHRNAGEAEVDDAERQVEAELRPRLRRRLEAFRACDASTMRLATSPRNPG